MELALVSSDLQFIARLATSDATEEIRSIAFLALMPYVSSVVVETANYLRDRGVHLPVPPQYEALIRTSRLRLKLTDDDRRDFAAVLAEAAEIADVASSYMKRLHMGLGVWKRLLQKDLGMYLIDGHLIGTTDVMTMNLGLRGPGAGLGPVVGDSDMTTLGPHMFLVAKSIGEFVAFVATGLGVDISPSNSSLRPPVVEPRDAFARRFYRALQTRISNTNRGAPLLLTMLAAQINTGRLLAPAVCAIVDAPLSDFRIRFLSAYHVASSLQTLLNAHYVNPLLLNATASDLRSVLSRPEIRFLRRQKKLRNIQMHYKVDAVTVARLRPGLPLDGLLAATVGSRQRTEECLEGVETAISSLLESLIRDAMESHERKSVAS